MSVPSAKMIIAPTGAAAATCGSRFSRRNSARASGETSTPPRTTSSARLLCRKRGYAVSVRRAPAAVASTVPPARPITTTSASVDRQRARRSAPSRARMLLTGSLSRGDRDDGKEAGARCGVVLAPHDAPHQELRRAGVDREAAVGEVAERVRRIEPTEHRPGAVGPVERLRRRDAPVDLQDAVLEHAVLGPAARVVLHARHLDPGHLTGGREPS